MRKLLLTIGLLAAFSYTATAENIVSLQGSYVNLGRGYSTGSGDDKLESTVAIAALGGTVSAYFGVAEGVGLLTGLGVYFPTNYASRSKYQGRTRSVDYEAKGLAAAGDLGVGWRLSAADMPLGVILGAVVRGNYVTFNEIDGREIDNDNGSSVLGAALRAMPTFAVSEAVYVVGSFSVGYDFLVLSHEPKLDEDDNHAGAFGVSAGLGVGFKL